MFLVDLKKAFHLYKFFENPCENVKNSAWKSEEILKNYAKFFCKWHTSYWPSDCSTPSYRTIPHLQIDGRALARAKKGKSREEVPERRLELLLIRSHDVNSVLFRRNYAVKYGKDYFDVLTS